MKKLHSFDVDGVIADSYGVMCEEINRVYNFNFCPLTNPMPYNLIEAGFDVPKDGFMTLFNSLVTEHKFPFMEGAVEVLTSYYEKSKKLIFITHRHNQNAITHTRLWLEKGLKLPFELYACHHCDKAQVAKDVGVTSFFDDHPAICKDFLNEGMEIHLYKAPWHVFREDVSLFPMVHSWKEIEQIIIN